MSADDPRRALALAAERLERVAERLGDPSLAPGELRALADDALALSAEITALVPRALAADGGE